LALYPCDNGRHRYNGPQQTVYPALLEGMDAKRAKLRLCQIHFQLYINAAESFLTPAEETDFGGPCAGCGNPDALTTVFLTVYEKGQERRDLVGRLCDDCRRAKLESLFLAS
jgi:hypothetical protein